MLSLLMIIGIIGYFTIPTVAGWIIQAGGMGSYNRSINNTAMQLSSGAASVAGGVAETEIQQIKKEYIFDRIKESIDIFGNQPERFGTILMSAVAVLVMLVSKALQKARELSAKRYDTEQIQPQMPVQESVRQPAEKETQTKPKIPPKPVMSAEAAAYPKLFKIYHKVHSAYANYQEEVAKWKNAYREKADSKQKFIQERLQNYQKEIAGQQTERNIKGKDRGER